jgi:metallo-beta-lactamase class B
MKHLLYVALLLTLASSHAKELIPDPPMTCDACVEWNQPQEPFRIYGNTWYVGTRGLSSILITSPQGHILIDGGLAQSAPLIAQNIAKLGFRLEDVKLILNSHTHYDHAGGIAALQRVSGAQIAASPASKRALEQGGPNEEDPQFGFGHEHNDFAPLRNVRAIRDGETLHVGKLAVTAHFTPGHTPGGTTWTWNAQDGDKTESVVFADSLTPVSAPGFKFSADPARVAVFEQTITTIANLDCSIMLATHPERFDRDAKLAASLKNKTPSFVKPGECRDYAQKGREQLHKRLEEERSGH